MNKLTAAISLTAAGFALSTAVYAEGTGKSASTSKAMTETASAVAQDRESIKKAQEQLRAKGYSVGKIDGNLGPRTSQAIREFQTSQGMTSTGELDVQTLSALNIITPAPTTGTAAPETTTGRSTTSPPEDQPMDSKMKREGRSPTEEDRPETETAPPSYP